MKRQIVISGAGSGIGRANAIRLSQEPETTLLLLGRREAALKETQTLLARPSEHRIVTIDLANFEASADALRAAISPTHLAGVIANAGVGGENRAGPDDRWDEIIDTNLSGTYHLIQACLPALKKSEHPWRHIVVVSSILARIGVPHYSAYCASKAGLLGLTRSLAAELASDRILVNAICPGWVETEMARQGIEIMAKQSGQRYEDAYRAQMGYVPLGKMAQPEEIAAMVAFLTSGAQTSITGQSIDVNNGAWMG